MQKNKNISTIEITIMAMAISLNSIGAYISMNLKFPLLMDSIGTVLIAILLGPKKAVITGVLGCIVNGLTFDELAIAFSPAQITTGYFCGLVYKKGLLKGKKVFLGVLIYSLPTAVLSAFIAAEIFGGVTTAGSSFIVQILSTMGVPIFVSVFVIQIITEYIDKFVAFIIASKIISIIPRNIKSKIS